MKYYGILRPDGRLQWAHKQSSGSPKLYMRKGQAESLCKFLCKGSVVVEIRLMITVPTSSQT